MKSYKLKKKGIRKKEQNISNWYENLLKISSIFKISSRIEKGDKAIQILTKLIKQFKRHIEDLMINTEIYQINIKIYQLRISLKIDFNILEELIQSSKEEDNIELKAL